MLPESPTWSQPSGPKRFSLGSVVETTCRRRRSYVVDDGLSDRSEFNHAKASPSATGKAIRTVDRKGETRSGRTLLVSCLRLWEGSEGTRRSAGGWHHQLVCRVCGTASRAARTMSKGFPISHLYKLARHETEVR